MKLLKKMFSSSNEVSWGRSMATLALLYVMLLTLIVMYHNKALTWVPVDPFWRDLILGLFMVSKGGETVQKFAKSEPEPKPEAAE